MLSCSRVEQQGVILTGTDLICVTVFVVLFVAFCDINAIMHGSTITHKNIGLIFCFYTDIS
jgi:hypothetical protein